MTKRSKAAFLLGSTALSLLAAAPAFAQAADQLQEVVVTATRQTSTVNRVPLSITAQTQDNLNRQGIQTVADLQKAVPALTVGAVRAGVAQFTVRGITATQGSPTTGLYLDDTPLQKRNNLGSGNTGNNGTPAPPLFDLERVEVLRGPQGTLYGGSSQGGTVRFITPTPSLTTYSGNARADLSTIDKGAASYNVGVAFGGPIVQDKLGFRVSMLQQRVGGYVDMVDPYRNGAVREKDANFQDIQAYRGSLLWRPTERASITASLYHSRIADNGGPDAYYLANPNTYTTTPRCYDTTRTFATRATTAVTCPANAVQGQTVNGIYQRPSVTYGPFNYLGPYQNFDWYKNKTRTYLDVASITAEYDMGFGDLKSITSYMHDKVPSQGGNANNALTNAQATSAYPNAVGFPLFAAYPEFGGFSYAKNERQGWTQEIRIASKADARPLSWVLGAYYSVIHGAGHYSQLQGNDVGGIDRMARLLWGLTGVQQYGQPNLPAGSVAERHQSLRDTELAGFGELNYYLTDKLKLIGGLRVSRVEFTFNQRFYGPGVGWLDPTFANSGLAQGSQKESPVTPKFGAQYQFTPNDLVYVTASKGFRAGGINGPLSVSVCGVGLANVGLTVNDIPTTYDSDTVWSYEAGAKMRLLNGRVQVNTSVYNIDWKGVQLAVTGIPGCGQQWVQNAGAARSQGFEFESQARIATGLTVSLAVSYDKAEYTQTATGPQPISGAAPVVLVRKGDPLPVPRWTINLGGQYDFSIGGHDSYIRANYSYLGSYLRTPGAGIAGWLPDTYQADKVSRVDARAGLFLQKGWELSVYVNNLFNSTDYVGEFGGRSGCTLAAQPACDTFTNYNPLLSVQSVRPREIGVQTLVRF